MKILAVFDNGKIMIPFYDYSHNQFNIANNSENVFDLRKSASDIRSVYAVIRPTSGKTVDEYKTCTGTSVSKIQLRIAGVNFPRETPLDDNISQYVPNKKYRTEYLAFCRNAYVQEIAKYSDYEYSVIIDMDDVMSSETFNEQGVLNSLQILNNNPKIGALTAISAPKYYDIWALRSSECNYDCWKKVFWSMKNEGLSYELAVKKYVAIHAKDYSQYTDLISVQSAFNGLAVYRNSALIECKYIGIIDGINSKTVNYELLPPIISLGENENFVDLDNNILDIKIRNILKFF
jgi:hypothetical protein